MEDLTIKTELQCAVIQSTGKKNPFTFTEAQIPFFIFISSYSHKIVLSNNKEIFYSLQDWKNSVFKIQKQSWVFKIK